VTTDTDRKKELLQKLYRLFSIRQRSEKEVIDYFGSKNYELKILGKQQIDQNTIDWLIDTLKQQNLINDLEFAKNWVEVRSKKKGLKVIKYELLQKGIDAEIVSSVMNQILGAEEQKTAEYLLEKKMRIWKNLPILEFKKKAYEFLMRRGFEYEVVKEVVDKIIKLG